MPIENQVPNFEETKNKEKLSSDKKKSLQSLFLGERPFQFDAFLEKAPTTEQLTKIIKKLNKPDIENVVFDLDGTLVPPYSDIPEKIMNLLNDYLNDNRKVLIYTNSPHSERLDVLRDAGIEIAKTGKSKPSLEGFKILCDQHNLDPSSTAMIGNSPITDMPLVENGADPFFALNILIDSIPPDKKLIESYLKYRRAHLFHMICVSTAVLVKIRNPDIFRDNESSE